MRKREGGRPEPQVASSVAAGLASLTMLPHVPQSIGANDEEVVLRSEL